MFVLTMPYLPERPIACKNDRLGRIPLRVCNHDHGKASLGVVDRFAGGHRSQSEYDRNKLAVLIVSRQRRPYKVEMSRALRVGGAQIDSYKFRKALCFSLHSGIR